MPDDDNSPISVRQAKRLFADWKAAPAIVLALSGGPDSIALMWLAARWRRALSRGPRLIAVTVDHGLRMEAKREARDVKRPARTLDLAHRAMRCARPPPYPLHLRQGLAQGGHARGARRQAPGAHAGPAASHDALDRHQAENR